MKQKKNNSGRESARPSERRPIRITPQNGCETPWTVEVLVRPRNGVSGDISTALPVETLLEAIRAVASGLPWRPPAAPRREGSGTPLTACERNVVELAALGMRNAEIARQLHVTEGTIKTHLNNAFRKLGLRNRAELTRLVLSAGLEQPGEQPEPNASADRADQAA